MLRKYTLFLAVIFLTLIITSCNIIMKSNNKNAHNNLTEKDPMKDNGSKNLEVKLEPKPIDPLLEQMEKMSLDEKIGQMLVVGIQGFDLNDNTRNLIKKSKVGGVIVFSNNVESTNQLLNLLNSLKSENLKNKVPLFLSVDEEGGRVTRMPKEFKKFPTSKAIGNINDGTLSNQIGSTIAYEIGSFGFNMDFAPVLDVNSNPNNPIIGDRSFGSNTNVVSHLGIKTMKGIQGGNVIPVVKHFPGHGDTSVDSHLGLPSVNNTLTRLKQFELIPFAVAKGEISKERIDQSVYRILILKKKYKLKDEMIKSVDVKGINNKINSVLKKTL